MLAHHLSFSLRSLSPVLTLLFGFAGLSFAAESKLEVKPGAKVVIIGNALAESMQTDNTFETLLYERFPQHQLVVRNLGWSADTINVRLRSTGFQDHGHTLVDHQPDILLAFFGFNESFAGPEGLPAFEADLARFLRGLKELKYPTTNYARGTDVPKLQDKSGKVENPPQIVLFAPTANQDRPGRGIYAAQKNNPNLKLYSEAMRRVAEQEKVLFVDLFEGTAKDFAKPSRSFTSNGSQLNAAGHALVAEYIDSVLFPAQSQGGAATADSKKSAALREAIADKNNLFYTDYRAVNGFYIYGGRKEPFGVVNFPPEFAKLRKMVDVRDHRIWDAAQGKPLPENIDDSQTGELPEIPTNFKDQVVITTPEESAQMFTVADGFQVELWASEVQFPDLKNPVTFTFDAQGRMWITTMPTYPQMLPGVPSDDKILILADTDADGRADKQTVFASGLNLPTGLEIADGGAYVTTQPDLAFLKDTNGDDVADECEIVLRGFDTADSHHTISAFEWGPGGDLFMLEGTFLHSQIETPHGPVRCANGAVYRYEPRKDKLEVHVAYSFANPWGLSFDKWGQGFLSDASGGANYFVTPFSGEVDFPRQHPSMKQFLVKQWRPTCGTELVASRHFPDSMQGDFLVNNCIGFQGVLQYRLNEEGSGYAATPTTPLLRSDDPNFRPVDLQFGPDGALYVLDWFNPLIGHMQHSIRDPMRDHIHGRIWRVTHKSRPLVKPPVIAGASVKELLELLKAPEDRTRYRVRRELRNRPTEEVMLALDAWTAALTGSDPVTEQLLLEALWVKQQHDVVDPALLQRLLTAHDGRARAAAVRVACCWRDELADVLPLLRTAANDPHPRVRLEAVRSLSFFDSEPAVEIAVESLLHPQDDYLQYALKETLQTLEARLNKKSQ
ncbi:PVC-type heme-binding CxxCH protein [Planctomicrobium sp. SH664]|uniref:PVC-type heme-binding CxxCH protein n=1 Tax=Planctomicrobium sp. SH664 TaxID=3448125 RepID=UPI003F5B09BD